MGKSKDYILQHIGKKYGRLTVLGYCGVKDMRRLVSAVCECGVIKEYKLNRILTGSAKSCGCWSSERGEKHGLTNHKLYTVWSGMIDRCYNESYYKYHRYGGRGVTMCEEWRNSFKCFYDWAIANGWKKGLQLDKDIKSPNRTGVLYSPDFCCFVTNKKNSRNRSNNVIINYNGLSMCIGEWSEYYNISYSTIQNRLKKGWPPEKIFTHPVRKFNMDNKKIAL